MFAAIKCMKVRPSMVFLQEARCPADAGCTCVDGYMCMNMKTEDEGCVVAMRRDIIKGRSLTMHKCEDTVVGAKLSDGGGTMKFASLYIRPRGNNWNRERAAEVLEYADWCDIAGGDLKNRPTETQHDQHVHETRRVAPFPDDLVSKTGDEDTHGSWLLERWPRAAVTVWPRQSKDWRTGWCWRSGSAYTLGYFCVGRKGMCSGLPSQSPSVAPES